MGHLSFQELRGLGQPTAKGAVSSGGTKSRPKPGTTGGSTTGGSASLRSTVSSQPFSGSTSPLTPTAQASAYPATTAGGSVARTDLQNEPIERVVDQSQTTLVMPGIAARPQRVSPLAATWQYPTLDPLRRSKIGSASSRLPWVVGAVGVLLGGALLYMAWE